MFRSEGRSLTLLRGGCQVLQQITSKHLLFVPNFSPNSPHLFLLAVSPHIQTGSSCLWPSGSLTVGLSLYVCGSWMRDTLSRLLWNLLCGAAAAHVRDFDRAAVISFSSVHVVGYRLFPLCAALLLELMCWSWSVRTYFGFVSDSAKGELTKVSFWKHQPSHCRPNAPKANNKMHWILCVHYVALHFPLMHAIYFRMKGHTLAPELLLFSEVSMNMSFKVHHNVSLSLVTPLKPLTSAPTWRPGSLQAQSILPAACHSHCWSFFL